MVDHVVKGWGKCDNRVITEEALKYVNQAREIMHMMNPSTDGHVQNTFLIVNINIWGT